MVIDICSIHAGSQPCSTASNNEICPSQLESCLVVWCAPAGGSVHLFVVSVLLHSIPRLLLLAISRLAVSCGLPAGGTAFLQTAPGQVWGRALWPESMLAHGEGLWSCPWKCSRTKSVKVKLVSNYRGSSCDLPRSDITAVEMCDFFRELCVT